MAGGAKQYRGFTLIEVIISFVLISFITVMVSLVLTSSYTMASKLKELPNSYYAAQDKVERETDVLSSYVKEKFRIQNELLGVPTEDMEPSLVQRLAELDAILAAYENETVTLFGKSVDVFRFTKNHISPTGQNITLHAGAVNFVPVERPTPIIDSVEIHAAGASVENALYFGVGTTVSATVNYNRKNYFYHYTEFYQWYVCTGTYHAADYIDGSHYENEGQYSTVYTIYPQNFTPISGATGASFTVDDSCAGKLLLCVVTPLSIGGAMGASKVSNYLYVSALPQLSGSSYRMVIDPSLESVNYSEAEQIEIRRLESCFPKWARLTATGSVSPLLSLAGAPTDTDLSLSDEGKGNYSRYLSFSGASAMRSSVFLDAESMVFAVARDSDGTSPDFLHTGGESYGFGENVYASSNTGDTGWRIVVINLEWYDNAFTVGYCNVDIAEIVVTRGTKSNRNINAVLNYLSAKYHIAL